MTFSDNTLRDYLAGTADVATTLAIEDAVETDDILHRRLATLDPFAERVKDAFDTFGIGQRTQVDLPTTAPLSTGTLARLPPLW